MKVSKKKKRVSASCDKKEMSGEILGKEEEERKSQEPSLEEKEKWVEMILTSIMAIMLLAIVSLLMSELPESKQTGAWEEPSAKPAEPSTAIVPNSKKIRRK